MILRLHWRPRRPFREVYSPGSGVVPDGFGGFLFDPSIAGPGTHGVEFSYVDQYGCEIDLGYVVSVLDSCECAGEDFYLDVDITHNICHDYTDGIIDITPMGDGANYTPIDYAWNDGATVNPYTGLGVGWYQVVVTNAIGCEADSIFYVSHPNAYTDDSNSIPVTCYGDCDGYAEAILIGAEDPISYYLDAAHTIPGNSYSNVCAGDYPIWTVDALGCELLIYATVDSPDSLAIESTIVHDCNGSLGTICVEGIGGTPGYSFLWDGGETTDCITNLSAGVYGVTITDMNGCTNYEQFTIQFDAFSTIAVATTDATCYGAADGTATVLVIDGVAPYTYDFDGDGVDDGSPVNDLSAGTYNLVVTDALGCTVSETVVIGEPSQIQTVISITYPPVCEFDSLPFVIFGSFGGAGWPYTYTLSGGPYVQETFNQFNDLDCNYTYVVCATDPDGCEECMSFTVDCPQFPEPTWTVDIQGTSCPSPTDPNPNDGFIDITMSGGSGSFWYQYTVCPPGANCPYIASPDVTMATAGQYVFYWYDTVTGCVGTDTLYVDSCCIDISAVITDATNCNAGDASIDVTISGANSVQSTIWTWNGSYFANTEDISGLFSGTYVLTVEYNDMCTEVDTFIVDDIFLQPLVVYTGCSWGCCDGTNQIIDLDASGGTGPYTFVVTGSPPPTDLIWDLWGDLHCNTTYTIEVTDNNGCVATMPYSYACPVPVVITPDITNTSCPSPTDPNPDDGSITVNWTSGGGMTFTWDVLAPGSSGATVNPPAVANATAGMYVLGWDDLATGCSGTDTIWVDSCCIDISAVITDATTCNAGDASIDITVAANGPIDSYQWTNSNGTVIANTEDISGLTTDTYTVEIWWSDSACSHTESFFVQDVFLEVFVTNESCAGGCCDGTNGLVWVGATGGDGSYSYSMSVGTPYAPILFGMVECGVVHVITVTDGSGCTDTMHYSYPCPPDPPAITHVATDPSCSPFGGPLSTDGSIDITPGTGSTSISWTWTYPDGSTFGPLSDPDISNLECGSYTLAWADSVSGCDGSYGPVVLNCDTCCDLSATFTEYNTGCTNIGTNGVLFVEPSGGSGTYAVSINPPGSWPVFPWSGGFFLYYLNCDQPYTVTITDDVLACSVDTMWSYTCAVVVSDVVTQPSCTPVGGPPPANGSIDISWTGGPTGLTWEWSGPSGTSGGPGLTDPDIIGSAQAGTYTFTWTYPDSSCTGTYTVVIDDVACCGALDVDVVVGEVDPCEPCDGFIDLTVTNGVVDTYTWFGPGCSPCTTADLNNLCTGSYTVIITYNDSCVYDTLVEVLDLDTCSAPINYVCDVIDDDAINYWGGNSGRSIVAHSDFSYSIVGVRGQSNADGDHYIVQRDITDNMNFNHLVGDEPPFDGTRYEVSNAVVEFNGRIYTAGTSNTNDRRMDVHAACYDQASGTLLWSRIYDFWNRSNEEGMGIQVMQDPASGIVEVHVAGHTDVLNGTDLDMFKLRLNGADGSVIGTGPVMYGIQGIDERCNDLAYVQSLNRFILVGEQRGQACALRVPQNGMYTGTPFFTLVQNGTVFNAVDVESDRAWAVGSVEDAAGFTDALVCWIDVNTMTIIFIQAVRSNIGNISEVANDVLWHHEDSIIVVGNTQLNNDPKGLIFSFPTPTSSLLSLSIQKQTTDQIKDTWFNALDYSPSGHLMITGDHLDNNSEEQIFLVRADMTGHSCCTEDILIGPHFVSPQSFLNMDQKGSSIDPADYMLAGDDYSSFDRCMDPKILVVDNGGKAPELKAVPNPTSGLISIELLGADSDARRVMVRDMNGRILMDSRVVNDRIVNPDLTELANGVYLIQVELADGQSLSTRVIVSK